MARPAGQAYEIIGNLILKGIVVIVVSIGWLMMVCALIHNPDASTSLTVATIGTPAALMSIIVYNLFPKGRRK